MNNLRNSEELDIPTEELDNSETTEPVVEDETTEPVVEEVDQEFSAAEGSKFYDADERGNLVDKQGRIVAAAGKERSEFQKIRDNFKQEREQNHKLTRSLVELTRETKALWGKYKELRDRKSPAMEFGLNTNEEREAMQIAALAKADPMAAVKRVLTIAQLRGMDISDLGVQAPLDPAVIAREVAQIQQNEQRKAEPEPDPMQKEVDDFLSRNPDAYGTDNNGRPLVQYIAEAKARFPQMTLDQIWYQIKASAQKTRTRKGATATRPVSRRQTTVQRNKSKGVSLEAAHPSNSFDSIATQLLKDIQADEGV